MLILCKKKEKKTERCFGEKSRQPTHDDDLSSRHSFNVGMCVCVYIFRYQKHIKHLASFTFVMYKFSFRIVIYEESESESEGIKKNTHTIFEYIRIPFYREILLTKCYLKKIP